MIFFCKIRNGYKSAKMGTKLFKLGFLIVQNCALGLEGECPGWCASWINQSNICLHRFADLLEFFRRRQCSCVTRGLFYLERINNITYESIHLV